MGFIHPNFLKILEIYVVVVVVFREVFYCTPIFRNLQLDSEFVHMISGYLTTELKILQLGLVTSKWDLLDLSSIGCRNWNRSVTAKTQKKRTCVGCSSSSLLSPTRMLSAWSVSMAFPKFKGQWTQ